MKVVFLVVILLFSTCHSITNEERLDSSRKRETGAGEEFHRTCRYDGDCTFKGQIFLPCEGGVCVCQDPQSKMMDVAFYSVEEVGGECRVGDRSPCGNSDGLTMTCSGGISCIEGRCRQETRTRPLNHSCNEDIDCHEGLVCRSNGRFPFSNYCKIHKSNISIQYEPSEILIRKT